MSDEIDSNQSHLCTTEDAFEKFQSRSMYEEDEYISLSDIVPPQPEAPDLNAEFNDIPYENEVVLESLEEQVPEVNSTIEINADENSPSETGSAVVENHAPTENQLPQTSNESRPSKPGRKKKIHQNELTPQKSNNEQTDIQNEAIHVQNQSSEATPATPTPRKRGRKPKNVISSTTQNNNIPLNDNPTVNKLPGRRGRPRKSYSEQPPVKEENSETEIQQDISMDSPIQNLLPKKRGRKKKVLPAADESQSNLEESIEVDQPSDMKLEQSINESTNSTVKIPAKKRGRPKKIHSEVKLEIETPKVEESTDNEDGDDICLSQLKSTIEEIKEPNENANSTSAEVSEVVENVCLKITEEISHENTSQGSKRNSKQSVSEDFEYNIDSIVQENKKDKANLEDSSTGNNNSQTKDSLLVEDTSKRPVRRKIRQLHYDEGSDEDPFANIELSDEDDMRGKKGRYYSDDEYIPGEVKRGKKRVEISAETDTSDSDIDQIDEEITQLKRKRSKKSDTSPSKKRGRKPKDSEEKPLARFSPEVSTIKPNGSSLNDDDDVEICLETSVIKHKDSNEGWGAAKEFESFLAKKIQGTDIKIKKASNPVQPLEIPVIDPHDVKKSIEISTQTTTASTKTVAIQTTAPYDVPMKDNVKLTAGQSEDACEFLNSIVKTTAELGELMTQKSQDFMKKKINTSNVTDTFKMDYCVRKSFLLFKLAKHNLMQMEEDLAKQYDDFLTKHNLSEHREAPKVIEIEPKATESDSDCEIVETPVPAKPKKVVPFNPKTVFLNKELSIKIAKKPTDDKKLNIKGRHTVWINDSVMVKKVKPTQSFLAQDSRNKKPPDYVTVEMVSAFFKQYYRKKALQTCAPFVSSEWASQNRLYVCSYFFANAGDFPPESAAAISSGSQPCNDADSTISGLDESEKTCDISMKNHGRKSPKTLFSLCTLVLQSHFQHTVPKLKSKCAHPVQISSRNSNKCPVTLYKLCVDCINIGMEMDRENIRDLNIYTTPPPLKSLCYEAISTQLSKSVSKSETDSLSLSDLDDTSTGSMPDSPISGINYKDELLDDGLTHIKIEPIFDFRKTNVQTLLYLSLALVNTLSLGSDEIELNKHQVTRKLNPNSLSSIAYECVANLICRGRNEVLGTTDKIVTKTKVKSLADICFNIVTRAFTDNDNQPLAEGLTINAINTLTEEAYHNIDQSELSVNPDHHYPDDDDDNFYDDETESVIDNTQYSGQAEENWMSRLEMKINAFHDTNIPASPENSFITQVENPVDSLVTRIKSEPVDETPEVVDTSIVKSEPISHLDEMTIIPENIVTKSEYLEPTEMSRHLIQRQNSSSFDGEQFETFVSTNKMMYNMDAFGDNEIFTQSSSRIRRQHEPDSDHESDMNMSLLVPQTYEPVPVFEKAKNSLMESSSDESSSKKTQSKKKPEKRRVRPKKKDPKPLNTKENPKENKEITEEKLPITNEIAVLTRRMREKIRQEEKRVQSSDSEHETEKIINKKGKAKNNDEREKPKAPKTDETLPAETVKSTNNQLTDDEIQCSNVDSTEKVNDTSSLDSRNASPSINNFPGFSAVDQNEITSYQKYVKYVYDQILPDGSNDGNGNDDTPKFQDNAKPLINPEEPVELLECEPTMPYMDETPVSSKSTKRTKVSMKERKKGHSLEKQKKEILPETQDSIEHVESDKKPQEDKKFVERHGWKCYPLDGSDTKLYQDAQIVLEKLPETFVETYFQYQCITSKSHEDDEVDRLTNLQTLNRPTKEAVTEGKCKPRPKCKIQPQVKDAVYGILGLDQKGDDNSRAASPTYSEPYDEFTPSEDEGGKVDEEAPARIAKPQSDNNIAKSSLMDDNESDEETKIKQEPVDEADPSPGRSTRSSKKCKPGPKSIKIKELRRTSTDPVMLTADKMMNKELNLLHAPVTLDDDSVKDKIPTKGPVTRNKQKNLSATKTSPKERVKTEDASSSEEEKQWFTIKEKLLKRMVNKNDTTREDDAKRAKLVTEFIERRGDGTESYIKKRRGVRSRRSNKKMLERQKQLKVLTRELFGDPSNDASLQRKKQAVAYFKGRRNIRKVIDKKLLAKSTVVANMEEFERKRRLNIKQNKLREVLRCEDGVNVLVINDEVCLEYDFAQHRPVVTVHPFFTKVMKAHQYEGVKFMWDACFESLESISAGGGGGGCILAHCMGLGKTLQVLALLHTVLTHPGVGMHRVLVCCPLSTVLNWVDEIHKWIGPVTSKIKVFELSKLRKTYERAYQLEDWYSGGGIFIIGYELFRSLSTLDPFLDDVRPTIVNKIRTALLDPGPDIIICDEGHLLKNDCSVLAVAMSRVATRRRIVLTGTPMQNNLREYYCMVNFVKPNLLGTYSEYSNRFENPIMNGQHRDSSEEDIKLMKARTHILHKVLEGCLQRQEASVLYPYLPKKYEYTVFISLTECQWDLYKHYLLNYGNTQNNKSVLKDFHILQKIWSHPQVLHNFQMRVRDDSKCAKPKVKEEKVEDDLAREELSEAADVKPCAAEEWWLPYLERGGELDSLASSNKFVAVFRILDESVALGDKVDSLASSNKFVAVFRILDESVALGDKVLIFSTSLFTMDTLEFFLKKINKWSLGQEYYRLDGSVPAEVRQKWCREFNAENNLKTKLFLISTRAGSLGLNMTAANRVIILDTSWNPAHDIQSIFRVYRFGQKKDCFIYRLVALGTMEQKIYERSVTKQAVACRVVDEQQIDRHYNMAELTELYKYDEAGVGVAGGVAVGVQDVVLLRVARDAALHAVHEHDSLLRGSGEQGLPEHERNAAWMQFQQEHAHKQMQEDARVQALIEEEAIKKLKQEEKEAAQLEKAKRPPRKYAKLKLPVKEEDEESILPTPTPAPSGPASRRGRRSKKTNVVTCCIPIQPDGAQAQPEPDPEKEAAMVRQISDILVQFNFNNHKTPGEINELVSRVRHIVTTGQIDLLDCTDKLTMSLANVFLKREDMPTLPEEPAITPDEPEITKQKSKGKKKGSKKTSVVEELPSTSAVPTVLPDRGRPKRRAAFEAQKSFDNIVDSFPDLDDNDWQNDDNDGHRSDDSDSNTVTKVKPNIVIKKLPDKGHLVINTRPLKTYSKPEKTKETEEVVKPVETPQVKPQTVEECESILLSDDDEPAPVKKKPGPARKTIKNFKPLEVKTEKEDKGPIIPLHPTLLSNANFIKIVAHTYLSGNPMLDEDAATLAAQYSTFKALKEYESTRKDITSGPIYDIAVKVLSMEVLNRLHNSKTKIVTSDIIASHPLSAKEPPRAEPVKLRIRIPPLPAAAPAALAASPADVVPVGLAKEPPRAEPVKLRIRIPPLPAALPAAAPAASPADVVPVGLYKRAEERPSLTADECILPDDDVHIVAAPSPAPARARARPPRATQRHAARRHQGRGRRAAETRRLRRDRRHLPRQRRRRVRARARARVPLAARRLHHLGPLRALPGDPGRARADRARRPRPRARAPSPDAPPPRRLIRLAPSPAAPPAAPPAGPSATSKRTCKPGDILRITEGGKIEVLQRRDAPDASSGAAPARPAAPTSSALPRIALTPQRSAPAPKPTAPAPKRPDPTPQRSAPTPQRLDPNPQLSAPTPKRPAPNPQRPAPNPQRPNPAPQRPAPAPTSASSLLRPVTAPARAARRAPNPQPAPGGSGARDDPLSILKDVIHIEADDYVTGEPTPPPEPPRRIPAAPARAAPARASGGRRETSTGDSLPVVNLTGAVDSVSRGGAWKPAEGAKAERVLGSVDLTAAGAAGAAGGAGRGPRGLRGATTIVGTSKSIILCGSGKAVTKTNPEKRLEIITKKTEKPPSALPKKVEVIEVKRKKPPAVDTSAPKKKKTDKPMTLKDFDIDDIDDIIELD